MSLGENIRLRLTAGIWRSLKDLHLGSSRDFAFPCSYLGRERERLETCKLAQALAGIKAEGSLPGAHLKFRARAHKIRGCCAAWGGRRRERGRERTFEMGLRYAVSLKLKTTLTVLE